jgi:uncharacterized protein DUF3311
MTDYRRPGQGPGGSVYYSAREAARPPQPPGPTRPGRRSNHWSWLLAISVVLPLMVPLYNRIEPRLFGFPFYYWCQLAFIPFTMLITTIVRVLTQRRR